VAIILSAIAWLALGAASGFAVLLLCFWAAREPQRPSLADLNEFERGDCRCADVFHSATNTPFSQRDHGA
jgi:hypothetical protein